MKHTLPIAAVCLLIPVLALVACDEPVNNVAQTSAASQTGKPAQEQQSGANQSVPSESSTRRDQPL
jgi:hypothetical protein